MLFSIHSWLTIDIELKRTSVEAATCNAVGETYQNRGFEKTARR
jgi:hypothetical protein